MVSVPLFARLYGFNQYGQIMLVVALGNLVTVLTAGWISQSWIRFQMTWENRKQILFAISFSIMAAVMVMGVALNISERLIATTWNLTFTNYCAGITLTIGMLLYYIIHAGLQSAMKSKYVLVIAMLLSVLNFFFPLVSYFIYSNINGYIFSVGFAYIISAIVGLFLFPKLGEIANLKRTKLSQWLKYGLPLSIWLSLQAAIPFLERLFIQFYMDAEMVGRYSALSELITKGFSLVLFPLTMAIHPVMVQLWNRNKQNQAIILWYQILKLLGISFLIFSSVYFIINAQILKVLNQLMGADYKYSLGLLTLLVAAGFLWQANLLFHKPLELIKRTHTMTSLMMISLIAMSIIALIFVPLYGLIGVAMSTFIGALSYSTMSLVYGIIIVKRKENKIQ